jgi:hypothetical protein
MEKDPDYLKLAKTLLYNGVCDHCKKTKEKMFKCSRCLVSRYCSVECQEAHWAEHKSDCKKTEAEDPDVKLSKVTPIAIVSYAAMTYSERGLSPVKYPIAEIAVLKESFFEGLAGGPHDPTSLLISAKPGAGLKVDRKKFYVQLSYRGKHRTAICPMSDFKAMMECKVLTNPVECQKEIDEALEEFRSGSFK